jgi:hypothetical protein
MEAHGKNTNLQTAAARRHSLQQNSGGDSLTGSGQ